MIQELTGSSNNDMRIAVEQFDLTLEVHITDYNSDFEANFSTQCFEMFSNLDNKLSCRSHDKGEKRTRSVMKEEITYQADFIR